MTTANINTLYVALELGCDKWVLASATQAAEKPRFRTVAARNLAAFNEEIAKAKARFGLPADAPVCTCYEAGRDGFWLHRALTKLGITNVVVDASSIEVNRRQKQIKSDPVDAAKLVNMLCRYHAGERAERGGRGRSAIASWHEGRATAEDRVQQPDQGSVGIAGADGCGRCQVPHDAGQPA